MTEHCGFCVRKRPRSIFRQRRDGVGPQVSLLDPCLRESKVSTDGDRTSLKLWSLLDRCLGGQWRDFTGAWKERAEWNVDGGESGMQN